MLIQKIFLLYAKLQLVAYWIAMFHVRWPLFMKVRTSQLDDNSCFSCLKRILITNYRKNCKNLNLKLTSKEKVSKKFQNVNAIELRYFCQKTFKIFQSRNKLLPNCGCYVNNNKRQKSAGLTSNLPWLIEAFKTFYPIWIEWLSRQ